jgi:hypothetical protein
LPDGGEAALTYDPDTGTLTLENTGNVPLEGQLGESRVSVGPQGTLQVRMGGQGHVVEHVSGECVIFDEESGEWQPMEEGTQIGATEEPLGETGELVDASAGGVTETAGGLLAGDTTVLGTMEGAATTESVGMDASTTAATVGTTTGTAPANITFADTFDRAAGPSVGNGWTEALRGPYGVILSETGSAHWELVSIGAAAFFVDYPDFAEGILYRDLGHLSTFQASVDFIVFGGAVAASLGVNGSISGGTLLDGMVVKVDSMGAPSPFFVLIAGPVQDGISISGPLAQDNWYTLSMTYDGSVLTGKIIDRDTGSLIGSHSMPAANTPGSIVGVGAVGDGIPSGAVIKFDNFQVSGTP